MATLTTVTQPERDEQRIPGLPAWRTPVVGAGIAALLTALAVLVHGYHPYAYDGGVYVAGVKRLLNPALYPHDTDFVLQPMRLSIFAPAVAAFVRGSHLGLPATLLFLHLATIWATLFAAWLLASACWNSAPARLGAVSLLACWLTLPAAGTALVLMDPYLTARSFSTPLSVLALAAAASIQDRGRRRQLWRVLLCVASLAFAFLMHPLMAAYASVAVLLLVATQAGRMTLRTWGPPALCVGLVAVAFAAHLLAPDESAAAHAAALSRTFWFPSQWRWYELIGLAAPLAILGTYARVHRVRRRSATQLATAAVLLGFTAFTVAAMFARPECAAHLIARLQPLRVFCLVYLVMALVIGAELGEHILRRKPIRWICALILLSVPMYLVQRATYSHSAHLEFNQAHSPNLWVQAFLWVRANTPVDAYFAIQSDYMNAPGEDAQAFRVIADRSSLPDYSNDGGEASVAPDLASAWVAGSNAQRSLDELSGMPAEQADAARSALLAGTAVDWLVLKADSATGLPCPYRNAAVKVCRLTPAR